MLNNCKTNVNTIAKPMAITCGTLEGIGSITLLKTWLTLKNTPNLHFFTINNAIFLQKIIKKLNLDIPITIIKSPKEAIDTCKHSLPVIDIPIPNANINNIDSYVKLGSPNVNNVPITIKSLDMAVDMCLNNEIKAIVTLPIDKYIMQSGGFNFVGHTEYLAHASVKFNGHYNKPVMMLASPHSRLKVVPVTIHKSLKNAINSLSKELIIDTVTILYKDLTSKFSITSPKILLLGLNPHAGENGLMGTEELEIISPAISQLKTSGINVEGPIPADTAFSKHYINNFDVIVGMYHDQVLTPFKSLLFDEGVNVTLGLPFIRTSPDHGTAFKLLKDNINLSNINSKSTEASILMAMRLNS